MYHKKVTMTRNQWTTARGDMAFLGLLEAKQLKIGVLPRETGESGGQEESLFSGDSLRLAFALPELSVGLEGGLEPRLFVAPP